MTTKTMRVLIAVLVVVLVASLVVSVVARHRHHSHGDLMGRNGTDHGNERRHSRRNSSGRGRQPRDPLEAAFVAHMDRVKSFRCQDPVPKALAVLSIQGEMSWRPAIHEEFVPENTILHRCGDASGCCQNHMHSCQAVQLDEVTLVFKVHDTMTGSTRYQNVTATNHTRCGCIEKSFQPK